MSGQVVREDELLEGRVVVITTAPCEMNEAELRAQYHELELAIVKQEAELPWEFHDDDSLALYVEAPELLQPEIYDAVDGFVRRNRAVDRRRELFRLRWQIDQALEGALVLIFSEPIGQA